MFAVPKIKPKNGPSFTLVSDIAQFRWEEVLEKEEIGWGSLGAVYHTEFNNLPEAKKIHVRDENSMKKFIRQAKLLESLQYQKTL